MQEILCEEISGEHGDVGVITLNRQKALNALNQEMIATLYQQLTTWSVAQHIKAVMIRAAEGRAFCAGGDIRSVYTLGREHAAQAEPFFAAEYQLNRLIFHYPKPYIALLDGMTMGGGAGISINGAHRFGTERLTFAMPETGIGFYPDVGASYFLSRLPHRIGFYLGLTGARIAYNDCFALGLIEQVITSDAQAAFIAALAETDFTHHEQFVILIKHYAQSVPPSMLMEYAAVIQQCFSQPTIETILETLEQQDNDWCEQTAAHLRTRSPTSLKVTLRQLQAAEKLSFDACMDKEYHITCQFLQGQDFFEGIRAVLIDKDQTPHWQPATLAEVSAADVEAYFK